MNKLIKVVEVGPRDGLQAVQNAILPTDKKIELILKLLDCGIRTIDVASFVHPKLVPQLADSEDVLRNVTAELKSKKKDDVELTCICPNVRGAERALRAGATSISIWLHGSEEFSQRNLRMSLAQHAQQNKDIANLIRQHPDVTLRGYISGVDCPYTGTNVSAQDVLQRAHQLMEGKRLSQLILADTTGRWTEPRMEEVIMLIRNQLFSSSHYDRPELGLHLHATYGTALPNIVHACRRLDIGVFESSVGGLGGCPFAPGASGNVATEDLVYVLHGLGFETGVDLKKTIQVAHWVTDLLSTKPRSFLSRVAQDRI